MPTPLHLTATGDEQKLPRKGHFWPNWRLLVSPRLDFPEEGSFVGNRSPPCHTGTRTMHKALAILSLRVVFPLTEPRKPPGWKSPKTGKKLQKPPPLSNPRKWGKITEKLQKKLRKYIFCNFLVIFPHFRGLDRGGEFCNFFPVFGDFHPGGFRGSVRRKTTRNSFLHLALWPSMLLLQGSMRANPPPVRPPPASTPLGTPCSVNV